jgi:hypothetical protein
MMYFKEALGFQGFSYTVLLNIVLAGLCENGQGGTATYYIQVAREKWGIQPNEIRYNFGSDGICQAASDSPTYPRLPPSLLILDQFCCLV